MAIIPITIYGDKILREKTKKVKQVDDEVIQNIRDMFETMRAAHGIGLAANQVGLNKSIFVIDLTPVEGYEESSPLVMINPVITAESDDSVIYEEGCLSLPNLRADVERAEAIEIKYLDTDEKEQIIEADDWMARVILHEYDHLIGKMIPDRVAQDIKKRLKGELTDIMNRNMDVDYPITD
ncbi:MAG: peptide deformylase [Ignavibacteriae bacterium HGW-Ignavibacteriae-2]|jgi:peptide deformylase|nr:MAG: peptide deformylase [Ignavibacteriae bacterium HGW-Ignavibacteriae-2]